MVGEKVVGPSVSKIQILAFPIWNLIFENLGELDLIFDSEYGFLSTKVSDIVGVGSGTQQNNIFPNLSNYKK